MIDEEDFGRVVNHYYAADLPAVEVVTDKFRAVAKNFLMLPIKLLLDLKGAHQDQDGSDLLLLYDACEMGFSPEDFEKLLALTQDEFLCVVSAWVNWEQLGEEE